MDDSSNAQQLESDGGLGNLASAGASDFSSVDNASTELTGLAPAESVVVGSDERPTDAACGPSCDAAGVYDLDVWSDAPDAVRLAVCVLDDQPAAVRWRAAAHLCRDLDSDRTARPHGLDPFLANYFAATLPPCPNEQAAASPPRKPR